MPNELQSLLGHTDSVIKVMFTADGQGALSLARDNTVRWWSLASGQEIHRLELPFPLQSGTFFPDGKRILLACQDGSLRLWNLNSAQELLSFDSSTESIDNLTLSPNGLYAAGNKIVNKPVHEWLDGKQVFVSENLILLWDIESGKEIYQFKSNDRVFRLLFSPDSKTLLSLTGSSDTSLIDSWNVENGQKLPGMFWLDEISCMAFSPDGRYLLLGLDWINRPEHTKGKMILLDREINQIKCYFAGHREAVSCVSFSPNCQRVLAGGNGVIGYRKSPEDNSVRLWDVASGAELCCFEGHSAGVICLAFSPDGHYALSGSVDTTIRLWQLPA